jgi:excinuclease ABC subunit B
MSQGVVVEQIIRPTGLIDPPIDVRPVKGQVDDLLQEIRRPGGARERVLVTTLTKRMAEDLTQYYQELGVRVRYLHSDIETLERVEILRDLRRGEFDVLVGINLLREGSICPKCRWWRSSTPTRKGSCARRIADPDVGPRGAQRQRPRHHVRRQGTDSMRTCIAETERRRAIQEAYNQEHGITPQSIVKQIDDVMSSVYERDYMTPAMLPTAPSVQDAGRARRHIACCRSRCERPPPTSISRRRRRCATTSSACATPSSGSRAGSEGLNSACCRSSNAG